MKVVFHSDFYRVYASDPAAAPGRMEAIVHAIEGRFEFVEARPAEREDLAAVHTEALIRWVEQAGVYDMAALAAGGAVLAAELGMEESAFGLIRPPGHHASPGSCWGFCYFNNMAVALTRLKRQGRIERAFVLDFDLHFGDGNVNCLESSGFVEILNPEAREREAYLQEVRKTLAAVRADVIGVSAGFDYHVEDWGGLLETEDYRTLGRLVRETASSLGAGLFGVLEGGYNHAVLGENVRAFLDGMSGD